MQHEEFIEASVELNGDPEFRTSFFHPLYVDEVDHVYFRFLSQAVSAHMRLQAALRRPLAPTDARVEVLHWASLHAQACRFLMASELGGSAPVLPDIAFGPFEADGPEGWATLGLSALVLEMILLHAGKLDGEKFWQFDSPLHARGRGFSLERAFALAEAGRLAKAAPDGAKRLRSAIKIFRVPGEAVWGETFITDAATALAGRIESRGQVFHDAIAAIHEADDLPWNAWDYLEPQLDRYAKLLKERFGFGMGARLALRLGLKLIRA